MPYQIKSMAGKPYRPSNSTEGDLFQCSFCMRCEHYDEGDGGDGGDCTQGGDLSILARSFWSDIGDADYPPEWTHDTEGRPTCTAFLRRGANHDPNQLGLFGGAE